jgi:hypothetical protein
MIAMLRMYANLLPNMAKRWSLMTTSERSWIIVQAHARSCGVPSMTLGPWLIMARDGMAWVALRIGRIPPLGLGC